MNQAQLSRWEALTEAARRCVADKQFDKAEEAFLAALREAEQFGDGDPRVAVTLNALARVYHRRSKFFPAAALLHRLLGIKEREHGEEHPELAGILSNLAEMYARLGDARQELELRERALGIRVRGGEAEGGPLEGIRGRIAELKQKLADETTRDEAARKAPRTRIPVPTGANDLPLIMPTPLASHQVSPFAPVFAPASKTAARPSTAPRAAMPLPAAPMASPAPVTAHAAAPAAAPAATPVLRPTPAPQTFTGSASAVEPIGAAPSVAPAPQWKPLAPPAPATSWPGERVEVEATPEPDDFVEFSSGTQRNWKPIAFGGIALAALAAAAVLMFGGTETSGTSAGDLAAKPAVSAPATVQERPAVTNPTEDQALEAGLANLQQEGDAFPAGSQGDRPVAGENTTTESGRAAGTDSNRDSVREPRLRLAIPSVSLDNVTKSIEAAARARVDSSTEAKDKQLYEYTGKQPRS
jgi:hypothetical protein